jgi:hypothetical protein
MADGGVAVAELIEAGAEILHCEGSDTACAVGMDVGKMFLGREEGGMDITGRLHSTGGPDLTA